MERPLHPLTELMWNEVKLRCVGPHICGSELSSEKIWALVSRQAWIQIQYLLLIECGQVFHSLQASVFMILISGFP